MNQKLSSKIRRSKSSHRTSTNKNNIHSVSSKATNKTVTNPSIKLNSQESENQTIEEYEVPTQIRELGNLDVEECLKEFDNSKAEYLDSEVIKYILLLKKLDWIVLTHLNLNKLKRGEAKFFEALKKNPRFDKIFKNLTHNMLYTFYQHIRKLDFVKPEYYHILFKYLDNNPLITFK